MTPDSDLGMEQDSCGGVDRGRGTQHHNHKAVGPSPGGCRRKLIAALTVAGFGLTVVRCVGSGRGAAPPPGAGVRRRRRPPRPTSCPTRSRTAAELKETGLRGHRRRGQAEEINGSTVVKVGETSDGRGADGEPADGHGPVRRARARGAPIACSCCSPSSATSGTPSTRTRTPNRKRRGPPRFDGPLHNQIPEPDRTVDNSTIWQPDFGRQYFQNLYFGTGDGVESLKHLLREQSSGRYS